MELNLCDGVPGDVLDLWLSDQVSAMSSGAVSFDVSAAVPEPAFWQVNLPDDPLRAAARLRESENSLLRSEQILAEATGRLQQVAPAGSATALSFSIETAEVTPERELLALFQEAQPVSFGLGNDLVAAPALGWEQAQQVFQTLMDKLQQSIAERVFIETCVAGRMLGRTLVGWTGDVQTIWPVGNTSEEATLHSRTVALALKSRETLLKMFGASVQMAISLSLRLSLPGGPLLALPAVLRFIKQMLELQNSRQPTEKKELWQTN